MNLHDQRDVGCWVVDLSLVVGHPGAIRSADLDQVCAALLHNIRNPKATADFDKLSPRHRHVSPSSKGGENQHHCGCAVVDDHGGLGAAELGEKMRCVGLARAALTSAQVELEITKPRGLFDAEWSTAQVGVQQCARGVHDPLE